MRNNGYKLMWNSYKTQRNIFNINIARQVRSPASKIFSAKIGFTVHRSHFDASPAPPPLQPLARGFNKSRGSFSSYPAAAETHGIKEISAAPVNLGLGCDAASWESRPACRYSTTPYTQNPERGNHQICFVISTTTRRSSRSVSFPDIRGMECLSQHHVHVTSLLYSNGHSLYYDI